MFMFINTILNLIRSEVYICDNNGNIRRPELKNGFYIGDIINPLYRTLRRDNNEYILCFKRISGIKTSEFVENYYIFSNLGYITSQDDYEYASMVLCELICLTDSILVAIYKSELQKELDFDLINYVVIAKDETINDTRFGTAYQIKDLDFIHYA
ncbi:hypothetical protein A0H76_1103 [Hepatospora eriocheir]|uniref:Uncharacterized protein n=1 Tax=Hepatospora eriocheir TaxID=1081669 RepID=A0A1X0QHR7_9MICR|nr:hypothetical protein A0H76_1103 [Hepatospora eriocheir]